MGSVPMPSASRSARGEHAEHARHLPRRLGIHGAQHAVGDARAHHHGEGLARVAMVVGVAAGAGDEAQILNAPERLADTEFHHRSPTPVRGADEASGCD